MWVCDIRSCWNDFGSGLFDVEEVKSRWMDVFRIIGRLTGVINLFCMDLVKIEEKLGNFLRTRKDREVVWWVRTWHFEFLLWPLLSCSVGWTTRKFFKFHSIRVVDLRWGDWNLLAIDRRRNEILMDEQVPGGHEFGKLILKVMKRSWNQL